MTTISESPLSEPAQSKQSIRKESIARRRQLSDTQRHMLGKSLATRARLLPELVKAQTIAAFVTMGSELPLRYLLDWLLQAEKTLLVPRLGTGREIGWSELSDSSHLTEMGRHRPAEPADAEIHGLDELGRADVILVPAFFIDAEGYRLGRGAGWYDQALLHRRVDSVVVGIVYPWETGKRVAALHEDHDVPVDIILTPESITRF